MIEIWIGMMTKEFFDPFAIFS